MRPLFFVLGAAPEKDIFRKAGQGTLQYGTGFVYEVGGRWLWRRRRQRPGRTADGRTAYRRPSAPAPASRQLPLPRVPGHTLPGKAAPHEKRICTPIRRQIRFCIIVG